MNETQYEKLRFFHFSTREEMGRAAAADAIDALAQMLADKAEVNIVFAAAPSQNEMLTAFRKASGIDWNRINAFHMDEYVGIKPGSPESFSGYLDNIIFKQLPFASVYRMNGMADPKVECQRYADLLRANPIDIVLMGIGENGHIAFNDPPIADFNDPLLVKVVELEQSCRQQQVNDGCFATIDAVPKLAITLTIPALFKAKRLFCCVPGERKAVALRNTLTGPVGVACPASILRKHDGVMLYADADAAKLLL